MRKLKYGNRHIGIRAHTCKKLPLRDRVTSSPGIFSVTGLMY